MAQIYLNNWQTKTTAAIDSSTNFIPVPADAIESLKAAGLPDISVADGMTAARLTLGNPSSGAYEILYCVGYQGQTLACNRGFENDAPARDWPAGALMYLSLTAGDLAEMRLIMTNSARKLAELSSGSAGGGSSSGGTKYSGSGPTLYSNSYSDASLDLQHLLNMRAVVQWYPSYPENGRGLLVAPNDDNFYGGTLDVDFRLGVADDVSTIAVQSNRFEVFWNVPSRPEVTKSGESHYVVDVEPGQYMLSLRRWPVDRAIAVLTRLYAPSYPGQ